MHGRDSKTLKAKTWPAESLRSVLLALGEINVLFDPIYYWAGLLFKF